MKGFFLIISAIFFVTYPSQSKAEIQAGQPAVGHFYCNAIGDFNRRLDVDFVSTTANIEVYDSHTGLNRRILAQFDALYSDAGIVVYETSEGGTIQFPSTYAQTHWFTLDFSDSYSHSWISFDCNQF